MNKRDKELNEAREELNRLLKPGDTIYTILRHRSASGMSRWLDVYMIKDNQPLRLTYHVSKLVGSYDKKREAMRVNGCGMDMGFHVVHNLSYALHGYTQAKTINGEPEQEYKPGYTFNHRWL